MNNNRPAQLVVNQPPPRRPDAMDPPLPSLSAQEATRRVFGDRRMRFQEPAFVQARRDQTEDEKRGGPLRDRGGRRTRRGGMNGTNTGPQIQLVNSGLGAPGGLTIRAPQERILFGDETPVAEPAPAQSPIPIVGNVKGIGMDITRRREVGPLYSLTGRKEGGRKTRRATNRGGDIVTHLLTIRNQIKLYHWQTKRFARHTATDALTTALDTNIDAFVESYMGRYGRPKVSGSIKLHNFSESAAKAFVAKETKYLERVLPTKIRKSDTDLLNLRDTILGDLNKVLYLFTLA